AVEDLMNQQQEKPYTIIDVRSPKEFNEATIPGSVNIPVFSNEERVEVGTIYKQVGQEAAKEKGLEIFSNKLRSEEHTSELQSRFDLVCRLLLEKKKHVT